MHIHPHTYFVFPWSGFLFSQKSSYSVVICTYIHTHTHTQTYHNSPMQTHHQTATATYIQSYEPTYIHTHTHTSQLTHANSSPDCHRISSSIEITKVFLYLAVAIPSMLSAEHIPPTVTRLVAVCSLASLPHEKDVEFACVSLRN